MKVKKARSDNRGERCLFPASSAHQIKVVLFCGGRGSATIIHELLRWPSIQLTLIVNAYDDGLSTGALRSYIAEMLGPSDFRKNLSYLLDPYSEEQYALKTLLEFRFPTVMNDDGIERLIAFVADDSSVILDDPFAQLFQQIEVQQWLRIRHFLHVFFDYVRTANIQVDYRDCSLGNLIFSGIYLEMNRDFNAAAKALSELVSSRASLVNVSKGENRILVALKEDGELLASEAQIVGVQSGSPIRSLFLVTHAISPSEWQALQSKSLDEKEQWLQAQEGLPEISFEAEKALAEADIILFGPGTQYSSLLPSYRIAQQHLRQASARIKALIMNLDADHDIQSLAASDIVDRALAYMGDSANTDAVITHILLSESGTLNQDVLLQGTDYKHCQVIYAAFANQFKKQVHNGRAVVETVLALWEKDAMNGQQERPTASIFIDIHQRSFALQEFYDELLEMDWQPYFTQIDLTVNQNEVDVLNQTKMITVNTTHHSGSFPEMRCFFDWLQQGQSEYLILLTGDGKYHFRDVILAIKLLEQSHFGAVFGSRNQSRLQFQASLRAVYGDKKILSKLSFLGSFVISAIFALRFGMLFSDPLTGFRLFKRSRIEPWLQGVNLQKIKTPIGLTTCLIQNNIEIAELPVNYRTFAGFVDPHWRIQRGLKNLIGLLIGRAS